MKRSTKGVWSNAFLKEIKEGQTAAEVSGLLLKDQDDPLQWWSPPWAHSFPSTSSTLLPISKCAFHFLGMYLSFLADAWWSIKVQLGCTFDFSAIKFKPVHNHVRDRSRSYNGWLLSGEDLDVHHFMPCRQKGLCFQISMSKGSLLSSVSFVSWSDGFYGEGAIPAQCRMCWILFVFCSDPSTDGCEEQETLYYSLSNPCLPQGSCKGRDLVNAGWKEGSEVP